MLSTILFSYLFSMWMCSRCASVWVRVRVRVCVCSLFEFHYVDGTMALRFFFFCSVFLLVCSLFMCVKKITKLSCEHTTKTKYNHHHFYFSFLHLHWSFVHCDHIVWHWFRPQMTATTATTTTVLVHVCLGWLFTVFIYFFLFRSVMYLSV